MPMPVIHTDSVVADDESRRGAWRRSALFVVGANMELRRLLEAFAAVNFAEWALVTSVAVHLYHVSGFLAVGVVGFRYVPAAIGSLFVAPFVHRHSGRSVLTVVAGSRAAAMFGIAVALSTDAHLGFVLTLIGIDAVLSSPYRPAQASLIPVLARTPGEVVGAAAASSIVKSLSQAAGATSGGLLTAYVNADTVARGAAVVMAFAALLAFSLRRRTTESEEYADRPTLRTQLKNASEILKDRHVSPIIVASGLRSFVRGQWAALLVATALQLFKLGPQGVGKFTASAGLGAIVAVPLASRLIGRKRLGTATTAAFIACGACIPLVGICDSAIPAYVLTVCWGVAMALADSTSFSVLYRMLTPASRATTIGLLESVKLALEGVGALTASLLVYLFGIRGALICVGIPLLLLITLTWKRILASDVISASRGRSVALLHQVPVFHVNDMSLLEDIASRVSLQVAETGSEVVREGEVGDRFYVISEGTAQVSMSGYPIGELGPGSSFGERALLRNARRSATVVALTDLSLLTLSREDFLAATQGNSGALEPSSASAGPSLGDPSVQREWTPKTLTEVLGSTHLFASLAGRAIHEIARVSVVSTWTTGANIVVQGETGKELFVILQGMAQVSIDAKVVGDLHAGDVFGEIALIHDVPRVATVTALTPVTTCSISKEQFVRTVPQFQSMGAATDLLK